MKRKAEQVKKNLLTSLKMNENIEIEKNWRKFADNIRSELVPAT